MIRHKVFETADLPLEVVILLIAGMMMLIAGILLFPVHAGVLPFYENGLYGLLLFIFALQTILLGRTPFGDLRRSRLLLAAGTIVAALGIVTCFVPDLPNRIPRMTLFFCFAPGGFLLLLQMFLSEDKFSAWLRYGGIFRHLILGCTAVYVLSMFIGLLILQHGLPTRPLTAVMVLLSGAAIVYLAVVLRKIYRAYPEAEQKGGGDGELPSDKTMMLVTGIFMLLLGVLLIPVSLGLLPFSGSAQLGLLMVIFSVQMLASGNTPIGPFPRSWLMILFGLLFAALGIVSSIIPEILVAPLTLLIGLLNITNGLITLWKVSRTCLPLLKKGEEPRAPLPPILFKLYAVQATMGVLALLFGTSMLVSHLLPALVVGVVLAANGGVLLFLLYILMELDRMQRAPENAPIAV
jgi:hypothetical protein